MTSIQILHPTTQYAIDVIEGRIIAGPLVRDACKRHMRDLEKAGQRGLYFNTDMADHVLGFFPQVLRLNGGQFEGQPFELYPPQVFIIGSLFGWLRKEDDTRRFRVAYIEQGKGNGKSPLVGGIGLYGMVADSESRAEIYAAATKKDQAMILFRDAVAMVNQSPALSKAISKSGRDDKVWNLFHHRSNSFFRPISADDGQSGPRPHIGLVDELHEHKTANVINMLSAGRKWRRQPMIVAITNSGTDKNSVCWEYHEMARLVCSGALEDDTFFGYVCSLDEGDDPFNDESCWEKANPLIDKVITREYLREEVNQARGMLSKESSVRRLNFCQWTSANNPLVPIELWEAAEDTNYTLELFRNHDVCLALDLSSTQDLTAGVFSCRIDKYIYWWPEFWIPEELLITKTEKDRVPYDVWKKRGHIRTTPGKSVDKDFVVRDIANLRQTYGFRIVDAPYDRWRIEDIRASCEREGVSLPLTEFGQGYQGMAPAIDAFEESLGQGTLRHNGNPCLRWNVANAIATSDPAGNRKLDKSKATGRIDGLVAGVMSHLRTSQSVTPAAPRIRWIA